MAPLDAAVALAEMDPAAVAIDRDLDLDVAGLVQPALQVERVSSPNAARASERQTFRAASSSRGVRTIRMPLPPPPAAGLIRSG